MGFYWHVHMQVAFVQPVNIPANLSWWHTLERLKEFDGGGSRVGTLFSAAARALPDGSAVPETVAKRARTARSVMAIRGEDSDSDDEYGDGDFEVLYNSGPQNFKDAGSAAVTKILGDDSGISVVLMHQHHRKLCQINRRSRNLFRGNNRKISQVVMILRRNDVRRRSL